MKIKMMPLSTNYEFWAGVYLEHGESEVRKRLIRKGHSLINEQFLTRWANPEVPLHPQNETDLVKLFAHQPFKSLPTAVFNRYLAFCGTLHPERQKVVLPTIWLYKPFDYDQIVAIRTLEDIIRNLPDPRRLVLSSDEYFALSQTCQNSKEAEILQKYEPQGFCLYYYGYERETSYEFGIPCQRLVKIPNFDPQKERPATPLGLALKHQKT